jgi:hypothetical protein
MNKKATTIIMVMSTITTGKGTIMSINMNMDLGTMNTLTPKKSMVDGAWGLELDFGHALDFAWPRPMNALGITLAPQGQSA